MALLSALYIGSSGLMAADAGMVATTENVSNSLTPGFHRRHVSQGLRAPVGSRGLLLGQGVEVGGILRSADNILAQRQVFESGQLAFTSAQESALTLVESLFGDSTGHGLRTRMDTIFDAMDEVTRDPSNPTLRNQVVDALQNFANTTRTTAKGLQDSIDGFAQSAQEQIATVNADLSQIAALNQQITSVGGDANAPALADQRDLLLRSLSERIGTRVHYDDTNATVFLGGHAVVSGSTARPLTMDLSGDDPVVRVQTSDAGQMDVTRDISGAIGGVLDARTQTKTYLDDLQHLAETFADEINKVHAAGFDADGNPGGVLFTYVPDAGALTLELDPTLRGDSRKLAIAGADTGNAGDIDNLIDLLAVRDATLFTGDMSAGTFASGITAQVGSDLANVRNVQGQREAIVADLDALTERLHGVDLDEEATNLIAYQSAYQAAARVISAADNMMDVLLNLV